VKALELVWNEFPVVVSVVSSQLYGVGAMQPREIGWVHHPMDGVSCTPVYQGQRCFQLRLASSEAVADWRRSHAAGEPTAPVGVDGFGSNLSKCQLAGWLIASVKSWIAIW